MSVIKDSRRTQTLDGGSSSAPAPSLLRTSSMMIGRSGNATAAVTALLSSMSWRSSTAAAPPRLERGKSVLAADAEQRAARRRVELERRAALLDRHCALGNALVAGGRLVQAAHRFTVR